MSKPRFVRKASGNRIRYSRKKLLRSLIQTGAPREKCQEIVDSVESQAHDEWTTREIYRNAFNLLKKSRRSIAGRYKLKNAIMELGPTGYPFEVYVSELMKSMGYEIEIGVIMKGKCVEHEIDILARKGNEVALVECKYHNQNNFASDVKVPLYINSRYLDLQPVLETDSRYRDLVHSFTIVTNTRFTTDACDYASCAGLKLLSWDYPHGHYSLKSMIDRAGLHPLTCMTTLTQAEKKYLLGERYVLCRDISGKPGLLEPLQLSRHRTNKILEEAREISNLI